MSWLRAKTCVFILFGLITFGQAYPYSYVWAEGGHAECGCNDAGRKCIHGCDLKKHRGAHDHAVMDHHDHGAMQGHEGHGADQDHAALRTDGQDEGPHWVSPNCSKQKKREIMSFRGDPCVPQFVHFFLRSRVSEFASEVPFRPIQRNILPDPPPPKA